MRISGLCLVGGMTPTLRQIDSSGRGVGREGKYVLSFTDEKDGDRRRRQDRPADTDPTLSRPRARKKRADSPELGTALRTVYQRTVDEDIPPEMLDLLGKLG